jgi:hypothetical protein
VLKIISSMGKHPGTSTRVLSKLSCHRLNWCVLCRHSSHRVLCDRVDGAGLELPRHSGTTLLALLLVCDAAETFGLPKSTLCSWARAL